MFLSVRRAASAAVAVCLLSSGCGETPPPELDLGPPPVDAGEDGGPPPPPDLGVDAGGDDAGPNDAGPDIGPTDGGAPDFGVDAFVPPVPDLGPDEGPIDIGPPTLPCPESTIGSMVGFAVVEGTTVNASDSVTPSCAGSTLPGRDFAYTFTAPATAPYTFDTETSELDTVLAVLDGAGPMCLGEELACNDDISFRRLNLASRVRLDLLAGQEVTVVVDSNGPTGSSFVLSVERGEGVCNDGLDDDGDGLVDCFDFLDCDGTATCVEAVCDDGIDNEPDGRLDCDDPDCAGDAACPRGDLVLIGHDYFASDTNANLVVTNSVFLTRETETIDILYYTEWADNRVAGEAERLRGIVEDGALDRGRSIRFTDLDDADDLDIELTADIDVLLIPEQERATVTTINGIAADWQDELLDFLERGGVVVVCSSFDEEFRIVSGTDLLTVGSDRGVSRQRLTVAAPLDPVADGVSDYTAPDASFAFTGVSGGVTVIQQGTTPVVVHRVYD